MLDLTKPMRSALTHDEVRCVFRDLGPTSKSLLCIQRLPNDTWAFFRSGWLSIDEAEMHIQNIPTETDTMRFEEALAKLREGKTIKADAVPTPHHMKPRGAMTLTPDDLGNELMAYGLDILDAMRREWRVVDELPEGWTSMAANGWRHTSGLRAQCYDGQWQWRGPGMDPWRGYTTACEGIRYALLRAQDEGSKYFRKLAEAMGAGDT